MAARSNGNGYGMFGSSLPIVISAAVVVLTMVGGFWSLADPRSDIKDIRSAYLSLREHEEFVSRFNKDITRLETESLHEADTFQTLLNARQTKDAADQATLRLEQRISDLAAEIHETRRSMVEQKQFDGRSALMQKQIDELQKVVLAHFEKDADRYISGGKK